MHAPEKLQTFRTRACATQDPAPDVTTGPAAAMFPGKGKQKMAAIEDDDKPKKKLAHEIGQDLALLSLKELDERIAVLQDEIARLEVARAKKQASRSAADQFFKR
jgi:uncharacterized small protein (DUF1192 family)